MTVFDRIYRTNAWNGKESRSGPGSGYAATETIARELAALVAELGVTSVLNAGCGDDLWTPDLPDYAGIDVSREAILSARARHPQRRYAVDDVRRFVARPVFEPFDLVIIRDAIQHLPLVDGREVLEAVSRSRARWVLASTFVGGMNVDVAIGEAYSPDLMAEPFWMGQPERLIFDGWGYEDGTAVRDPRKHLGLWRLAS